LNLFEGCTGVTMFDRLYILLQKSETKLIWDN